MNIATTAGTTCMIERRRRNDDGDDSNYDKYRDRKYASEQQEATKQTNMSFETATVTANRRTSTKTIPAVVPITIQT